MNHKIANYQEIMLYDSYNKIYSSKYFTKVNPIPISTICMKNFLDAHSFNLYAITYENVHTINNVITKLAMSSHQLDVLFYLARFVHISAKKICDFSNEYHKKFINFHCENEYLKLIIDKCDVVACITKKIMSKISDGMINTRDTFSKHYIEIIFDLSCEKSLDMNYNDLISLFNSFDVDDFYKKIKYNIDSLSDFVNEYIHLCTTNETPANKKKIECIIDKIDKNSLYNKYDSALVLYYEKQLEMNDMLYRIPGLDLYKINTNVIRSTPGGKKSSVVHDYNDISATTLHEATITPQSSPITSRPIENKSWNNLPSQTLNCGEIIDKIDGIGNYRQNKMTRKLSFMNASLKIHGYAINLEFYSKLKFSTRRNVFDILMESSIVNNEDDFMIVIKQTLLEESRTFTINNVELQEFYNFTMHEKYVNSHSSFTYNDAITTIVINDKIPNYFPQIILLHIASAKYKTSFVCCRIENTNMITDTIGNYPKVIHILDHPNGPFIITKIVNDTYDTSVNDTLASILDANDANDANDSNENGGYWDHNIDKKVDISTDNNYHNFNNETINDITRRLNDNSSTDVVLPENFWDVDNTDAKPMLNLQEINKLFELNDRVEMNTILKIYHDDKFIDLSNYYNEYEDEAINDMNHIVYI